MNCLTADRQCPFMIVWPYGLMINGVKDKSCLGWSSWNLFETFHRLSQGSPEWFWLSDFRGSATAGLCGAGSATSPKDYSFGWANFRRWTRFLQLGRLKKPCMDRPYAILLVTRSMQQAESVPIKLRFFLGWDLIWVQWYQWNVLEPS